MNTELFTCFKNFRSEPDEKIYDCADGCCMELFRNVNKDDFNRWVDELAADGFEVMRRGSLYGNLSACLKSHVQINAFYTPDDSVLRVTVSKNTETPCFEPQTCVKECEPAFYCFENDHTLIDCGMCLMLQCPDYSFFVVDSGHYFQFNDNDRIYKFMRERTPEGRDIVINGWAVTHAHTDHVSKLVDFLRYNLAQGDVIIEGFYMNLLSSDYPSDKWSIEEVEVGRKFRAILEKLTDIPVYKIHSGQRIYIRNMEIEVLYTHEDAYPEIITDYNDSSCALMINTENTRIFIPGDGSRLAGEALEAHYGENLRCDIAQIAHHGHFGLPVSVYELLQAKTVVFPITRIMFDEEYPRNKANRRAIELADEYYISSDGTVKIPLPYRKGGTVQLPDETFEDFAKIKRQWGYDYTDERKRELYNIFLAHGGDPDKLFLPVNYKGYSIF